MLEEYCDRCGSETAIKVMSQFNTESICMKCRQKEEEHPKYDEAVKAEKAASERGNYNFKGIGLPLDLNRGGSE